MYSWLIFASVLFPMPSLYAVILHIFVYFINSQLSASRVHRFCASFLCWRLITTWNLCFVMFLQIWQQYGGYVYRLVWYWFRRMVVSAKLGIHIVLIIDIIWECIKERSKYVVLYYSRGSRLSTVCPSLTWVLKQRSRRFFLIAFYKPLFWDWKLIGVLQMIS